MKTFGVVVCCLVAFTSSTSAGLLLSVSGERPVVVLPVAALLFINGVSFGKMAIDILRSRRVYRYGDMKK